MEKRKILMALSSLALLSLVASCAQESQKEKSESGKAEKEIVTVVETKINESGELIVVYSDGTEQNLGVVKNTVEHTVNFYFDTKKLASVEVRHGEKATVPSNISVDGYSIKGWNSKEDGGYRWLFSAYPVLSDLDLYADYEAKAYTVTFIDSSFGLGQKTMEVKYNSTYDFSSVFNKLGYTCSFQDADGNNFDTIGTYTLTSDLTLYASWATTGLVLESEDIAKGTVDITAIKETSGGTCYTIKATPKEGYVFDGWYKGDEWVFQWAEHDYVTDSQDVTLTAHFITEEEQAKRYAATPEIDEASKTLTFGYYPQTRVQDTSLISKLEGLEENGYLWRCYKGNYYKKVVANPAEVYVPAGEVQEGDAGYIFEDGAIIEKDATYWFKCEKITWRILTSGNGSYSLVSEKVLDASQYDETNNNYANSDIAHWLNNTFASEAFQFGALSKIQESSIDNSVASTGDATNQYACENTTDLVYLPSVKELKDTTLYPDASYRTAVASDYARASGAYCSLEPTTYNAYYWTRSPNPTYSCAVHSVDDEGGIYDLGYLDACTYGVRPVISIKIS